ncbi:MAG: hypothetical protein HY706_00860 [Candidatus Hydrogenedentes bacterium]|nr:hypothetical protein [Candidatus Hydrogenedentota bacterium]
MTRGGLWTKPSAHEWMQLLDNSDASLLTTLQRIYGPNEDVLSSKLRLLRQILALFVERFGDRPVRIFRSPGRINLRGMHVDTHGGYLNLMTHQREVVIAVRPSENGVCTFVNTDPQFEEVSFNLWEETAHPAFARPWLEYITHPEIQDAVFARRGHWGNFLRGAVLSAQHRFPQERLTGVAGVIGSDLPRGAALSSSTALSVATFLAALGCKGRTLEKDLTILAVQDAEWFTGARGGVSDQTAMLLCDRATLVNVALLSSELDTRTARYIPFPEELRVLVINSFTERSLSGAQLIEYTRNRFAYSLAMEILRQEMHDMGLPDSFIADADRLSNLTAESFAPCGGVATLYRLLRNVPEEVSVSELKKRYELMELDAAYERYFGTVPMEMRPARIALRGPLLYGIAESERARLFPSFIVRGDFAGAGRLMTIGHDGDRRIGRDSNPYVFDVSDAALEKLAADVVPIYECPGVYGASTPVLDALVDRALEAGALGACLTGAGIAGSVLALSDDNHADQVAAAARAYLASETYLRDTRGAEPLSPVQLADAVTVNCAPEAAGEIALAP